MRWWRLILILAAVLALVAGGVHVLYDRSSSAPEVAKTLKKSPAPPLNSSRSATSKPSPILFTDITSETGIDFVAFSGTTPEKHFPTANGSGLAMIDFDQDGWLDLYFLNLCRLDVPGPAPPNALMRSRDGQSFERNSEPSGTDVTGFSQGVTVGDYNNDGFPDLYVVRYGPNILLENNGDGTFSDRAAASGLDDPRWGTSAAFFDFDEDGCLDLYVANYGKWDMDWHKAHLCGQGTPFVRLYCGPKIVTPEVHALYHSLGDGRFVDEAATLGVARPGDEKRPAGRGQGVVAADLNGDGHVDLYVANDQSPNFLFINTGRGAFDDQSELSCAAYNADGVAEAGMGVDAADVDRDGRPDLFVTNFFMEYNTIYKNLGGNLFQDNSHWSGVAAGSMHAVGWGTALEDFDDDGWPDIFVVNGHVDDNMHQLSRDEAYAQRAALWRNVGKGRFEKLESGMGSYFDVPHVSRGAAFGDLDNDGDVDVVVSYKDEPITVLRNDSRSLAANADHAWIQLHLVGTRSNRDAVGAAIECHVGSTVITRQIKGGRSYLSAHDLRVAIGLGEAEKVDRIVIRWPSGAVQEMANPELRHRHTVSEPR